MANGSPTMSEQLTLEGFQAPNVGASDSLAKTSPSLESKKALTEQGLLCSSELWNFLGKLEKTKDPTPYSSKMLGICCLLMEDGTSPDFSLSWTGGGYDAEWQVLNSKDFGVPQNRERVFIIGHSRKASRCEVFPIQGIDRQNSLQIKQDGYRPSESRWNPQRYRVYDPDEALAPTLDDMGGGGREPHIIVENEEREQDHGRNAVDGVHGISRTMLSRDYKDPVKVMVNAAPEVVGGFGEMKSNGGTQWYQQDRIYDGDGIATSLTSNLPGGVNLYSIPIKEATEQGYDIATEGDSINTAFANSSSRRGRVGHGIAQTLDTCATQGTIATRWNEKHQCEVAIRKLTPKECFRLQGWTDDYFERAEFVNSDSQLYKQAGNGVTVTVIQAIGERLHEKE